MTARKSFVAFLACLVLAAFTATAQATPITPTITFTHGSPTYDASSHAASAVAMDGSIPVSGTFVFTYDGGSTVPTNAGTYAVHADFTPTDLVTYATAMDDGSLTIAQKAASVTADAKAKVETTGDPALTGTLSGFLTADGVTPSYGRTTGEAVGVYTISATLSSTGLLANYSITYTNADFTVWSLDSSPSGDGLSARLKMALGLDVWSAHTDTDGITDVIELFTMGTCPKVNDTDGDSIDDDVDAFPLDNGDHTGGAPPTLADSPSGMLWASSGESPNEGGVYLQSGAFQYSFTIAQTKGVGPDAGVTIGYYSQSGVDSPVGHGMSWIGAATCAELSNGDVVINADGVDRTFVYDAVSGTYASPSGCACVTSTLVKVSSTKFEETWPTTQGSSTCGGCGCGAGLHKITFENGHVSKTEDLFNNAVTYTQDTSGKTISWTNSSGGTYLVGYYSSDRVATFTAPDLAVWTLGYNLYGELMYIDGPPTSDFPAGVHQELRYMNNSSAPELNGNLISITDGTGTAWMTLEYDSYDRVTKQCLGGNDPTFDYSSIGSNQTTVTDAMGNVKVWAWNPTTLAKTSLTEVTNRNVRSGEGDYTTTWTHDGAGFLTSVTYPRGNGIKYTLNSVKLPTEVRRKTNMSAADNNTNDIYDSYTYDGSKYYGTLSHTDPRGHTTNYVLNSYGQPTQVQFPPIVIGGSTVNITNDFTYNSDGTVDSFTDGEGYVTSYGYYTSGANKGRLHTKTVDSAGLALTTTYAYTDAGYMSSVTDPRNNTTTYTVERYGNVTEIDAPSSLGYVTQFVYDGALRVVQKKVKNIDYDGTWLSSPQWWTTTTTYTASGKPATVVEDVTASTTRETDYAYDANDQLTSVTRGSVVVSMSYDERGLLYQRIRDPGGSGHVAATETYNYDWNRNVSTYVNARNKTTSFDYDYFDRRTKTTNALGHYEDVAYDKNGNVTERKNWDYNGGGTSILMADHTETYDDINRATEDADLYITSPSNIWYSRTRLFDNRGLVTSSTDRLSRTTTYVYDGAGRRISKVDPLGNETVWTPNENGNVTTVVEIEKIPGSSSTESHEIHIAYDALNRTTTQTVVDATSSTNTLVTEWDRDALNFVRRTVDPKGNVVTFVRDGLGRTKEKHEDLGSSHEIVTTWDYDDQGNITQLADDNSHSTVYSYDNLNRLLTKSYADSTTVSYQYDADGNISEVTDQSGSVLDYGYDDVDRRTGCSITRATGVIGVTSESWSYDGLNRLTQAQNDDTTVNLMYDSLSRVTTEQQGANPIGSTPMNVFYEWNAEGERTKVVYPSLFEARETRDDLGRLSEIKDSSNASIAAFSMYGAGRRLKQLTYGNVTKSVYGYDGFRRTTDISHQNSSNTEFAGFAYAWDANSNPSYEKRRHLSGTGDVYAYDKVNRLKKVLTNVVDPAAEIASPGSQTYDDKQDYLIDDVFNITEFKVTPYGTSTPTTDTSYTANSMNEYSAVGSTSLTYTYNGALKNDGTYKHKYDAHDRLVEVDDQSNNVIATYKYDSVGLGRRTSKTVGAATTRYVNANQQQIEEYDGSGSLLRAYTFGDQIDQVVSMDAADVADVDGDSNTTEVLRLFAHTQLNGSVTHVTAPNQSVAESYKYDAYGNLEIRDKSGSVVGASQVGNSYTYTGRQLDIESKLYYYRARQYSPSLMRFVQMDPYEYVSIPNSFVYVVDRPIAKRDPMGLEDTSAYDATGGGATGALAEASVLVAGWEASGIAGTSGLPGNAQGERDAFRHCLWMCLMVQLLVNDDFSLNQALHVASSAGKGHDPKNDKSAKMDLANNATSLKRCAPKCAGKSEKCCVDCCWDLLEQKALQVNTPSHPVPGRDYPNYTCGVERPGYWKIARGIIFGPVAGSE